MVSGRGRPPALLERPRVSLPLFAEERQFYDRAAEKAGLSRAEWMRRRCTEAAEAELGESYLGPRDVYDLPERD